MFLNLYLYERFDNGKRVAKSPAFLCGCDRVFNHVQFSAGGCFYYRAFRLVRFQICLSPFVTAIGAVFLTAGLALQGSVSNYAAGVLLIIFRLFKVGDTLLTLGVYGVIEEMKLSYTTLCNEDEELITIPNKQMIGDILVNSFEYRVVESSIGVSYAQDPSVAIEVIYDVWVHHPKVSKTHTPVVGIAKFGDSAIELGLRYWVPTKHFLKHSIRLI